MDILVAAFSLFYDLLFEYYGWMIVPISFIAGFAISKYRQRVQEIDTEQAKQTRRQPRKRNPRVQL